MAERKSYEVCDKKHLKRLYKDAVRILWGFRGFWWVCSWGVISAILVTSSNKCPYLKWFSQTCYSSTVTHLQSVALERNLLDSWLRGFRGFNFEGWVSERTGRLVKEKVGVSSSKSPHLKS